MIKYHSRIYNNMRISGLIQLWIITNRVYDSVSDAKSHDPESLKRKRSKTRIT